jgi:uncharacterized protein YqgV (UPF0045/DUF77 family)
MPGGSVRFVLDDGGMLTLAEGDLSEVYELLWKLVPKPGAVSVATMIRVSARSDLMGSLIDLDVPQSAAMREAVALLHP